MKNQLSPDTWIWIVVQNPGSNEQFLGQLDQEQETIVICHTGVRSLRVCYYLLNEGFDKVANLSGGVHAWATKIDTHMPTY